MELYDSMHERLEAAFKAKGGATQYKGSYAILTRNAQSNYTKDTILTNI